MGDHCLGHIANQNAILFLLLHIAQGNFVQDIGYLGRTICSISGLYRLIAATRLYMPLQRPAMYIALEIQSPRTLYTAGLFPRPTFDPLAFYVLGC